MAPPKTRSTTNSKKAGRDANQRSTDNVNHKKGTNDKSGGVTESALNSASRVEETIASVAESMARSLNKSPAPNKVNVSDSQIVSSGHLEVSVAPTSTLQQTIATTSGDGQVRIDVHEAVDLESRPRLSTVEEMDDYLNTPLGRGINHQFESYRSPVNILPGKPTVSHIENCIGSLTERIKHFREHFTDSVGWIGEFEGKASRFENELDEVKDRCQSMGYLNHYAIVFNLNKELTDHVESLRAFTASHRRNVQVSSTAPNLTSTKNLEVEKSKSAGEGAEDDQVIIDEGSSGMQGQNVSF